MCKTSLVHDINKYIQGTKRLIFCYSERKMEGIIGLGYPLNIPAFQIPINAIPTEVQYFEHCDRYLIRILQNNGPTLSGEIVPTFGAEEFPYYTTSFQGGYEFLEIADLVSERNIIDRPLVLILRLRDNAEEGTLMDLLDAIDLVLDILKEINIDIEE